jgi:glycosyltransferase involved in cell wall biosynthesis
MKFYKDLWVIIPAYNEGKRICSVIKGVKQYCKNIVVVDDGSKDNTSKVAKNEGVIVLRHIVNLGKGAALKTGCDFAVKNKAKILIAIDADGQHDPREIPNFINALNSKDIVFGYRIFDKNMPFVFRLGNSFINFSTRLIYGISLKDTQSGYRAFTADAYKKIRWKASDYSMESEMIANAGKRHIKYKEIPIKTIYTDKYKGTTIFDGIRIVINMFLWRLKR